MPLDDLIGIIGDTRKNGLGTAFTDYLGNNTNLGRNINSIAGKQLIGSPANNNFKQPEIKDEHLGEPDENGNRWFNEAGKKMLNDHLNQFGITQPEPFIPQATPLKLPDVKQGDSGQGGGAGGLIKLIGMI